jgi:hypothetical protein
VESNNSVEKKINKHEDGAAVQLRPTTLKQQKNEIFTRKSPVLKRQEQTTMAQGGSSGLLASISMLRTAQNSSIHGLINYIDTKAKCRLKKFTCKGTVRQAFIRDYRLEWRYS